MKTFIQLREHPTLISRVPNIGAYLGHTPSHEGQAPEPLTDHVSLVVDYALHLVDTHGLEQVIDGLLKDIGKLAPCGFSPLGLSILKAQVLDVWEFHDYGKINKAYQHERLSNPEFDTRATEPFQTFHSGLGAGIFLVAQTQKILSYGNELEEDEVGLLLGMSFMLAIPIFWHHSPGIFDPYEKWKDAKLDTYWPHLLPYLKTYGLVEDVETTHAIWIDRWESILTFYPLPVDRTDLNRVQYDQSFSLFLLLKLTYSLLTASDYLATSHYMQQWPELLSDVGILTREDKVRIVQSFRTTQPYNQKLYEQYGTYIAVNPKAAAYKDQKFETLNMLRQSMAAQVRQQVLAHPDQRLFYLEAPTGGGKTNLSMLALSEMLAHDLATGEDRINKVYYVFPFTTLVTQTYQGLQKTLGLNEYQIAELHSRVGMPNREGSKEGEVDAQYGKEKKNYLHYLFGHYPITVLTHVRFFNLLKTHRKEPNYQHHRLANSLVIIDELQSYPPKEWARILDFVNQYAQRFNMRFVLMSATLPKLNLLKHAQVDITPLLPNSKAYFQNPNFGQRCSFKLDLLQKGKIELPELAQFIHAKSMSHAATDGGKAKPKGSVFVMVEFIFKKRATELAQLLKSKGIAKDFDEIFVMSGTILEPRRREIIGFLKDPENRHKKVLLITTQVVEAGVDIDMDIGFKDTSLVDSDEQLAGRINRNVKKKESVLYLFNLDRAVVIYGEDLRYKNAPNPSDHARILREKDFDTLYNIVLGKIDEGNLRASQEGILDYRALFARLDFPNIDRGFKLIDAQNVSLFVPLSLPLTIKYTDEEVFSPSEVKWLTNIGAIDQSSQKVSGELIWKQYEAKVENREGSFLQSKIDLKRLQAIMSRFTFQLMAESRVSEELKKGGWAEEKLGYLYLVHYSGYKPTETAPIYDYYLGLLDEPINGNFL